MGTVRLPERQLGGRLGVFPDGGLLFVKISFCVHILNDRD
jgi:hypothetical protein